MGNILDSIPDINYIAAKDGRTNERIEEFYNTDDSFDKIIDIYHFYHDIKWSERKLLKENPIINLEYMYQGNPKFTVNIYEVEDQHISLLPKDFTTEVRTVNYSYTPESGSTYIFLIEETNQLIDVTEGLKELINKLIK